MSDIPKKIKYFVMDVDGTLTDGKIYMGENGEVCKAFNIKDGYGICHLLPAIGAKPIIITGRKSKILENRCRELGITELHQGIEHKKDLLTDRFRRRRRRPPRPPRCPGARPATRVPPPC